MAGELARQRTSTRSKPEALATPPDPPLAAPAPPVLVLLLISLLLLFSVCSRNRSWGLALYRGGGRDDWFKKVA